MVSQPGKLDKQIIGPVSLLTMGGSSLGQSFGGHQNMRNSGMNRYTIANISECQRYLRSIYFDAHSTNNCQDVDVENHQIYGLVSLTGSAL